MKRSNLYHPEELSSLYVHVPFCRSKCPYCDFYSVTSYGLMESYSSSLLEELSLRQPRLCPFPTVYFGGGTPSLMSPSFFEKVLSHVGQFSEVTVEVNPEDGNRSFFQELRGIGVNRLSIGVQALTEGALRFLNRTHSLRQGLDCVEMAVSVFDNVSVDIIYGIPGNPVNLEKLEWLISMGIKHISIYALTVYEGTPLHARVKEGLVSLPNEEEVAEEYYRIRDYLISKGFYHYEISNFALPGFESRHNICYWNLDNYVGIGASASGFVGEVYWRNISNVGDYCLKVRRGELPEEERVVITGGQYKEFKLAMGLRLSQGVDLSEEGVKDLFEEKISYPPLSALLEEEYLVYDPPVLKLGERGLFVSNSVIASLICALF